MVRQQAAVLAWRWTSAGSGLSAKFPRNFRAWIDPPHVAERPYRRGRRGRGRKTPRLASGSSKARTVEQLARLHPRFRDQAWEGWRIKDGDKGPIVWDVKHALVYVKNEDGLPADAAICCSAANRLPEK